MKTHLLAFGLIGMLCSAAFSQSPAELDLYEKLTKGPNSAAALESVLKKPDEYSALILYFAAHEAFKEQRLADSGFLFYAAQLRMRFDEKCFSPKGTGANSPLVLYGALSQEIGSLVNPAVMADPKAFAKAFERLKAWSPKTPKDYDPGYEFTERKTEQEARAAAQPNHTEFIDRMAGLSTLLNDAEYFAAFRTLQAFNGASDEQRPSEAANDKAIATMKRIEKEKKIKGVFGD